MTQDEQHQESMRKFLEAIRNYEQEESEAVWRFMESLHDSELTEQDWVNLFGHRAPSLTRKRR